MILPIIFTITTSIIILFQIALALGFPWGSASMGGKFPGVYPKKMRILALINAFFLFFLIIIVLSKSNIAFLFFNLFSNYAIWFVVLFTLIQVILHIITSSKIEKIWLLPVLILFITSLLIALNH